MEKTLLYYIDGYHGGIRGHMPLGCWRDILEALKNCPQWKLGIDVEPVSWDFLKMRDPAAYDELREMIRDQSIGSRIEMVAGSYAQPYGWITDGESNIRHLTMGINTLKKHFPWIEIKTYAVQEPCWTSAMPQILKSLRFEQAVLKNPSTAWGGYSAGFNAEVCLWEGPDGTQIPMVPRYACEELKNVFETESVYGDKDFAEKCIANGIPRPAGMYFQDLGWPARPRMKNKPGYEGTFFPDYLEYTTWREYFETIAGQPEAIWNVSQEVFQGALPWGERVLVRMARQVRRGEAALLNSERIYALSQFLGGETDDDSRSRLDEAWGHLLMTQHHDAWICAGAGPGERNWAWKTSAQIYAAERLTDPIKRKALYEIGKFTCPVTVKDHASEMISVFNPLARPEIRTVSAEITSARGIESFDVYDGDEKITSQYIPTRKHEDGSKNAGYLTFNAPLPGFGAKAFRIEPSTKAEPRDKPLDIFMGERIYFKIMQALAPIPIQQLPPEAPQIQTKCSQGNEHLLSAEDKNDSASAAVTDSFAYLENTFYRITFDLQAGGTISSLYDKRRGAEVTDQKNERKFNEYSGYFINEARYISSTEQAAQATVMACGPVYAALLIQGRIGESHFTQMISVTEGDVKINVRVIFHFPEKTYIGEPHEIPFENNRTEGYRSHHDGRYKLNAWFPTLFEQKQLYKDAAYDVCKSNHENTHFKHWNEIKHNILIGWVDVSDGEQGLAIMADHTTSYTHGDGYPLGLTMAWGWDAGFWWRRRQLKGFHELVYAIMPHAGDWRTGDIWHEHQKMLHVPMAQRVTGRVPALQHIELIAVDGQVQMSAAYLDAEDRMLVRLFNPGRAVCAKIAIDEKAAGLVELVELDGLAICRPDTVRENGKAIVNIDMREFGICTLRITR